MALRVRAEPIDRDIELMLSESRSPKAQSATLAEFAKEQIEEAKQTNRSILGRVPRYSVSVDGRDGAPLESVQPNGYVIAEFELVNDVLSWIADQLQKHSPVKSGKYQKSHTLFADGQEIAVGGAIPTAAELVFISSVPYARKIERGASSQAPDGVYQAVAVLAQQRFGNIAKISFGYRTAIAGSFVGGRAGNRSDNRNPAVIVRVR
jgi:hypothetical protein